MEEAVQSAQENAFIVTPLTSQPVYSLSWLRGIAALMVCIFHVKKYIWADQSPDIFTISFTQGFLGVYVFFIVSGFVIPYSMHRNKYSLKKFFRFIAKRLVRIQPPYIIMLFVFLIWTYCLYQWKGWGQPWLFDLRGFVLNVTYLVPFFKERWIVIIFWTLAIEFQFYILTGLFYDLLMRNKWWRYGAFIIFLGLGKIIPEEYLTVFNNYIYFIIGFQLFLYDQKKMDIRELIISLVIALGITWFLEFLAGAITAVFTIAFIYLLNFKNRIADFFGEISYSLYLSHGLACSATALFTIGMNSWLRFFMCLTIGIAFATIYYFGIEKIFLRLSKKVKY